MSGCTAATCADEVSGPHRSVLGHCGTDLGQIQARRKVVAVPDQHPGPQFVIGAEGLVRGAQRVNGREVESAALRRAIDPDYQYVAVALDGDGLGQRPSLWREATVDPTVRVRGAP